MPLAAVYMENLENGELMEVGKYRAYQLFIEESGQPEWVSSEVEAFPSRRYYAAYAAAQEESNLSQICHYISQVAIFHSRVARA